MRSYITFWFKLQSTRFELLSGRVLSCTLGRKPYRCVWLTGGGSSGCSICVGIFKTLLNRSTFIEVHKLLKSGRSGEQYPSLLLFTRGPARWYLGRVSRPAHFDRLIPGRVDLARSGPGLEPYSQHIDWTERIWPATSRSSCTTRLYMGWRDVTGSMVTIRAPFCGITRYNALSWMAKIYRVI